jgi:hypothetical protein
MNSLCLERFRQLVETFDIIGYRKATNEEVWLGNSGATMEGICSQDAHFILRRREQGDVPASMVCDKCHHWASAHGLGGCRAYVPSPIKGDASPHTCGCLETFPVATRPRAPEPKPLAAEQEIRNRNREACEEIFRRYQPNSDWADAGCPLSLETLRRSALSDTPFHILAALVWAYRKLDTLEAEVEQLKQDRDSPHGTEAHLARMAGEYQRQLSETREELKKLGEVSFQAACEYQAVREENERQRQRLKEWIEEAGKLHNFIDHVLDQPDDRLYHAEDGTWWRREGLELKAAEAPQAVEQQKHALDAVLDLTAHLTRKLFEKQEELTKWSAEARSVRRETDHLKERQKKLERALKAGQTYRVWFDTCTKTQIEGWEEKTAAASDELDAALEDLKGPDESPEAATPMEEPPCHSLPRDQWCDREGPGGFMGHTCYREEGRKP